MKIRVFDTEGVGLNYSATKLHNLCYTEDGENFEYTTDYNTMKEWLSEPNVLWVGHYAVGHDVPAVNTVLGLEMTYKQVWDTMALSWYLYPDRPKHGLEYIGNEHGIKKVDVANHQWEEGDPELMKSRVIEDVKINWQEYQKQKNRLLEIYENWSDVLRLVRYLGFKFSCLSEQEANPLTLDVEKAQKHYDELTEVIEEKKKALAKVMPKVPGKTQKKPKNCYKQDGSYSKLGKEWFDLLKEMKLPSDTEGPVVVEWQEGNPGSNIQIKDWLFSLGWQPCTYKYERNKVTGDEKKIPQVRYVAQSDPRKGELTDSVLRLKEREPAVEELEGLTVAQHRRGIFEGFLSGAQGNTIVASAGGFTNTLRLKHRKPIVNLPGVDAPWGKEIRGCIVAPDEDHVLCGADVSSLEDSTKRHFLWDYDPDYVESMNTEGFDPHMTLLVVARKITQEDYEFYVDCKVHGIGNKDPERFKELDAMRAPAKTTNYSSTYKVGVPKLARETGMTKREAQQFLDAFWELNWAILKLEKDQYVKTLKDGSMWLKNPVSGFYHSLRSDRDKFSTLNQSTGDYIFNLWVANIRKLGVKVSAQVHDEVLFSIPKGKEKETEELLKKAMDKVNETLKLNVTVQADAQFGGSYDQCH